MRELRSGAGERGSVTAELALALPAVMAVLLVLLSTGQVVLSQVRCVDAARAGARAAARGDPNATVQSLAGALAPDQAIVSVTHDSGLIRVEVIGSVSLVTPTVRLPLHCGAVASAEVP